MKGFLRWTLHCTAAFVVFLAPSCLFAIPFYPLFKILMPEFMERMGY